MRGVVCPQSVTDRPAQVLVIGFLRDIKDHDKQFATGSYDLFYLGFDGGGIDVPLARSLISHWLEAARYLFRCW